MKVTALLPMKGNSERVPNKNLKTFNGSALYHAIGDKLLRSEYIDKLVINTDSDLIAQDAESRYGDRVIIIARPDAIQGDYVSMNEIIQYDLTQLPGDNFLQTHSTNPLLKVETLDNAVKSYFDVITKGFDSVFSVTRLQTRLYDATARPVNHDPNELRRTQDLDPLYEENSNFYIFSRDSFSLAGNKRIGLKPSLFEVNKLEAVDIDEPEDFILAELMYKNLS